MSEGTRFGSARLLEEHDIPDVLEVLFTEEFFRKDAEHMKRHLTRVARQGLDKYSNNLVAERNGKAVGRAVIDTSYPPYAELAGLLVHPRYRGQGVGTDLIKACISLASQFHCNLLYVMTWKDSPAGREFYEKYGVSAHRLYRKFGFHPAMLQGFTDNEEEICLFRFSDTSCYQDFIGKHPLSVLSVSGRKIDFHGNQVYEMRWSDPQTNDSLSFHLKGKRHESMPRIAGVARKEGPLGFDAWTEETTPDITLGKSGEFRICLENTGKEKLRTQMSFSLPKGTTIDDQPEKTISEELDKEAVWELKFGVKPDFEVPVLSFWTIIVTCQLQINEVSSAFPISAGFEMDRPPKRRKE